MPTFAPLSLSREQIIAYTPEWTGERCADGRPHVSDDILERMKLVSITEAWALMQNRQFEHQYEGKWERVNGDIVLCGRALTTMYMPLRPSLQAVIDTQAKEAGQVGPQSSWPIYAMQEGDVYIADVFEKVERGAIVGDNLSTAIWAKTKRGMVINGSVRDLQGVKKIEGFTAFMRGTHPHFASGSVTLVGINCPVRIGHVTVFPGDVVLGKPDGLIFVPPHLAEDIVTGSEIIRVRDIFGKICIREGRYLPGEIDRKWEEHIEKAFSRWLAETGTSLPIPAETISNFLKGRTW